MNDIKCPKCPDAVMKTKDFDGVKIEICGKCNGIWLNKGELNSIAHPIPGDLEFCSVDHIEEDRISDFSCPEPQCKGGKMVRVNFITYSDIILDFCKECEGIWLDRGELDAINSEIDKLQDIPESWDHKIMVFLSKLPF